MHPDARVEYRAPSHFPLKGVSVYVPRHGVAFAQTHAACMQVFLAKESGALIASLALAPLEPLDTYLADLVPPAGPTILSCGHQ